MAVTVLQGTSRFLPSEVNYHEKHCKTIRLDQVNQLPASLRQESEDAAVTAAHRLSHFIRIGGHCRNRCGMGSLGEDNGESECDSKSGPDKKSWMDHGSIQTNGIQWVRYQ